MGGYRQWTLPKELIKIINNPNYQISINQIKLDILPSANQYKDLIKSQLKRYQIILNQWTTALAEKNHTIVLMDDNIDTSLNANHNKKYKIMDLSDLRSNHINTNDITQHNFDFTRYASHQPPSCIDHIYSNCPNNMTNISTDRNIFSDHCTITGQFNSKKKFTNRNFLSKEISNF